MVSESATRHSPPSSSSCARGSANADRLVYCSGSVTARTRAAGGAHCGPVSRPARPPKVSTARAPSTGLTSAAVVMPWIHQPPAVTIASPGANCGTRPPWPAARPVLANVRPGCAPPKSRSDSGMGSEPCPAIQYATWKSAPGCRVTMTCGELSRICQAPKPAATTIVPARPHQPVQAAAARPGWPAPGAVISRCPGSRRPTAAIRMTASGAEISTSGAGRSLPRHQQGRARDQPGHGQQHRQQCDLVEPPPGPGHPASQPHRGGRLAALGRWADLTGSGMHEFHSRRGHRHCRGSHGDRFIPLTPHAVAVR